MTNLLPGTSIDLSTKTVAALQSLLKVTSAVLVDIAEQRDAARDNDTYARLGEAYKAKKEQVDAIQAALNTADGTDAKRLAKATASFQ